MNQYNLLFDKYLSIYQIHMYKSKMLSDFYLYHPSLYSVIFFFILFLLQFHFSNSQANYSYFDYDEGYAYKKQYQLPTTFVQSHSTKNEDDLLHRIFDTIKESQDQINRLRYRINELEYNPETFKVSKIFIHYHCNLYLIRLYSI